MRITPAHAGKTIFFMHQFSHYRDHPRSRGKDISLHHSQSHSLGSPPLTRERQFFIKIVSVVPGITPADAGKTYLCQ